MYDTHFMHNRSRMTIANRSSHPHNVGTEHDGISPTRQTSPALSAKRREVCMSGGNTRAAGKLKHGGVWGRATEGGDLVRKENNRQP